MHYTATYSPDDNKLRLYAATRLPEDLYRRVRAAGFIWAPKQELFVAPAWTPQREDLLLELAGEIDDEDTSLLDRAEERAERFDEYSDKRASDAASASAAVKRLADGIPLGQPILVGHHSARHARRDAERIENGMRRAVKMWETSEYWERRAAGAVAHAKYKERPDVRERRIKNIEAAQRKTAKSLAEVETLLKYWRDPVQLLKPDYRDQPDAFDKAVTYLAERDIWGVYERNATATSGFVRLYEALRNGVPAAEVQARAIANKEAALRPDCAARRYLAHYENRLKYERAMLAESGYIEPPKAPTKAVLPILNYAGTVVYANPYHKGETVTTEAYGMTSAEYAKVNKDYKGTRISADGTHRVRTAYINIPEKGRQLVAVYFTDKKQHPKPGAGTDTAEQAKVDKKVRDARRQIAEDNARRRGVLQHNRELIESKREETTPNVETATAAPELTRETVEAMRDSLKAGVQVVTSPDLFPTPTSLAERMAELAGIEDGHRVLEPSAGTGNLLKAISEVCAVTDVRPELVAIDINPNLTNHLRSTGQYESVVHADFLSLSPNGELGKFDRVVMNPPFSGGVDIRHIMHARDMLKPGGRLVALCANGPRQREKLQGIADYWEDLPDGSFAQVGTNVRVALLTIEN